ncbi:putative protein in ISRm14 (plasmid) [Cereibacter sphaeroides WS8N]|nr:putative protein in ISRm14 [Cereibacter sphaeroides WS8N]
MKAFEAAKFELSVERAARLHEQAVVAEKDAFIADLKELIGKLEGQIAQYRQAKFGPKSEKLDPAKLELALEDLETAKAETEARIAAVEERIAASALDAEETPRAPRRARALPDHLPRVERVIEPESIACPCGCGDMARIGEDRTERLDVIPARYQVIVTIRPKYACPKGRIGVVQAKAPAHLLEGSWPTEALLAHVAVAKHSEHMPLNRQAVANLNGAETPLTLLSPFARLMRLSLVEPCRAPVTIKRAAETVRQAQRAPAATEQRPESNKFSAFSPARKRTPYDL